jgi:hypothetical protein
MSQFRRVASPLAVLLILATAACGDDEGDAESASDQVCDARSELSDDLQGVVDDVADGNLGEARDQLDDVQSSLDDLSGALDDLEQEQREELEPHVDHLQSELAELDDAESLDELSSTVDSALASVESILGDVGESLDCG